MDSRPIGLFDSGVGGLTIFSEIEKILPNENYIYFGDTKNLPYGSKSKSELIPIAKKVFDFLEKKNVKAVVMACNTTSSLVYDELKGNYDFEIYPLIQIASKCIANLVDKKIGVLATEATVKSNKYKLELQQNNPSIDVMQIACPGWVKLVEDTDYNSQESHQLLRTTVLPLLQNGYKDVILGCTHYPYLTNELEKITDYKINFINPSKYFTKYISEDLSAKGLLNKKNIATEKLFYVSSNPEKFKNASRIFYDIQTLPYLVDI